MKVYEITIPNNKNDQQFLIEELNYEIKLRAYLSNDIAEIYIPNEIKGKSVTEICDDCFFNHKEIKSVVFPDALKRIGCQAFAMCSSLQEIIFPDRVCEIDNFAFRDCISLKRIVLPKSLKCLKTGVFSFCYFDSPEIILNDGLEIIETAPFGMSGLNIGIEVEIPASVKSIAPDAFEPGTKIIYP